MNLIRFQKVDFRYPYPEGTAHAAKALDGITVGVAPGEYVALLGESGSGKTTFLKLCNALLAPDRGEVLFKGMDSRNDGLLCEIRRGSGMVFQDPESQIIGTTVAEDVAFGPENLALPPEVVRERVREALQALSLQAHADTAVHLLTAGQKLKVALAGALAMHPDCLLLDDPAAPLGAGEKEELRQLLRTLNRDRGIAVLHATCDPEDAAGAHRVILLRRGRVVLEGTPAEVLTHRDGMGASPRAPSRAAEGTPDRHGEREGGAIRQALLAGRYLPGASPLHRCDPRTKLALLLLLMVTAFALATPAALALLLSITLALGALCGRSLLHSLKGLRPILWLALVAATVQLTGAGGTPLADHGALQHITREGVAVSVLMVLRLLLLATSASLLTCTTTPAALGDGVGRVLRPLSRIGLPASQLATMLQVSLRLLPIIVAEAEGLIRTRAMGRDGTLLQRVASLPPLLVPLFAGMARRGEALAEAMEARCYGACAGRTRMTPLSFSGADLTSVALLLIMLVAAAGVEYLQR